MQFCIRCFECSLIPSKSSTEDSKEKSASMWMFPTNKNLRHYVRLLVSVLPTHNSLQKIIEVENLLASGKFFFDACAYRIKILLFLFLTCFLIQRKKLAEFFLTFSVGKEVIALWQFRDGQIDSRFFRFKESGLMNLRREKLSSICSQSISNSWWRSCIRAHWNNYYRNWSLRTKARKAVVTALPSLGLYSNNTSSWHIKISFTWMFP